MKLEYALTIFVFVSVLNASNSFAQSLAQQTKPAAAPQDLAELKAIDEAFPSKSHQKDFARYTTMKSSGLFPATFYDYKLYRAERRENAAKGLITAGAILAAISVGLFIPTMAAAVNWDSGFASEDWVLFCVPAVANLVVGLSMMIPGIIMLKRVRPEIGTLEKLRDASDTTARLAIAPWASVRHHAGGMMAAVRF
mgnify:FL=1